MRRHSDFLLQAIAVAALVAGVTALGDLRATGPFPTRAAEAGGTSGSASWQATAGEAPISDASSAPWTDELIGLNTGDPEDAAPSRSGSPAPVASEDGVLVPAIYARDPDVRFVYARHVSKWM